MKSNVQPVGLHPAGVMPLFLTANKSTSSFLVGWRHVVVGLKISVEGLALPVMPDTLKFSQVDLAVIHLAIEVLGAQMSPPLMLEVYIKPVGSAVVVENAAVTTPEPAELVAVGDVPATVKKFWVTPVKVYPLAAVNVTVAV